MIRFLLVVLMALPFFTTDGKAASLSLLARAELQSVSFGHVRWVTNTGPPIYGDEGKITVTSNTKPFGLDHALLALFDVPNLLFSFEVGTDDTGRVTSFDTCLIGQISCRRFGDGTAEENEDYIVFSWLNVYADSIMMGFNYNSGTGVLETYLDAPVYSNYNGLTTNALGVGAKYTLTALPVPVPASWLLLLSTVAGLAGITMSRRSRSRLRLRS